MRDDSKNERQPKYLTLDDVIESLAFVTRRYVAFVCELDTGPSPMMGTAAKVPEPVRQLAFQSIYDEAAQRIYESVKQLDALMSDLQSRLF